MRNLTIGKKLMLTFGVVIVLFFATVAFSMVSLRLVEQSFTHFYETGYQVRSVSLDMRRAIQSAAKNIGYALMSDDRAGRETYVEASGADLDTLAEGTAYLQEWFHGDMALVERFQQTIEGSAQARERVYRYILSGENDTASAVFFSTYRPLLLEGMDLLGEIDQWTAQDAEAHYQTTSTRLGHSLLLLFVLLLVVLFTAALLAARMTKGLTGPIEELETAAKRLAAGQLDVTVAYESRDELGGLANSIRDMVLLFRALIGDMGTCLIAMSKGDFTVAAKEGLYVGDFGQLQTSIQTTLRRFTRTLVQINAAADQVSEGADQVAGGAQSLAQGSTEQASAVEELASTLADVSGQIRASAANAEQANELAAQTGEELLENNRQMDALLGAMGEITDAAGEIGKIIKTIEEIAFQTNILALNAAVEAARAGTAGKGFAVVAGEVRSLAAKSAAASHDTSALIENTLRAVEKGTQIAHDTAGSLLLTVEGARQAIANLEQISAASTRQAQAMVQITQGVEQVSSVVQTNSAYSEESAAASEELSSQAQLLKTLVGRFVLRKDYAGSFPAAARREAGRSA